MVRSAAVLLLMSLAPFAVAPAGAGQIELATYLAEYDLSLAEQPAADDIASVTGLIVLEFSGSACAGYVNDGRTVTAIDTVEGDRLVTDTRSRTVERPDGGMDFASETYASGALIESASGTAFREEAGLRVELSEPDKRGFVLPGAAFPTEQVIRILEAARASESFVTLDIFDGSQDGELVYQTATVIGAPRRGPIDDAEEDLIAQSGMADQMHWPVTISYFERNGEQADATPDFVMAFELYENGIGRGFTIDYGEFKLSGRLSKLTLLPPTPCD